MTLASLGYASFQLNPNFNELENERKKEDLNLTFSNLEPLIQS